MSRPTIVVIETGKKSKCKKRPSPPVCCDWVLWQPVFTTVGIDGLAVNTYGLSVYRNTGNFVEFQTGFIFAPPAASGEYPLFGNGNRFLTIVLNVPVVATIDITNNNFSGLASLYFFNGDAESESEARQKAIQYDTTPVGVDTKENTVPNKTTVLLSLAVNNTLPNSQTKIWIRGIYRLQ